MKKKLSILALLLALAALGFVLVSCDGGGNGGGGGGINLAGSRWVDEYGFSEARFTSSNVTLYVFGMEMARASYRVESGGTRLRCSVTSVTPTGASLGISVGEVWFYTILNNNTIRDDDDGTIYRRQ